MSGFPTSPFLFVPVSLWRSLPLSCIHLPACLAFFGADLLCDISFERHCLRNVQSACVCGCSLYPRFEIPCDQGSFEMTSFFFPRQYCGFTQSAVMTVSGPLTHTLGPSLSSSAQSHSCYITFAHAFRFSFEGETRLIPGNTVRGVPPPPGGYRGDKPSEFIAAHKNLLDSTGVKKASVWHTNQLDSYGYWLNFDRYLSLRRLREEAGFSEEARPEQGWYRAFDMFKKAGMIP